MSFASFFLDVVKVKVYFSNTGGNYLEPATECIGDQVAAAYRWKGGDCDWEEKVRFLCDSGSI